jgi:hypothetical protein
MSGEEDVGLWQLENGSGIRGEGDFAPEHRIAAAVTQLRYRISAQPGFWSSTEKFLRYRSF